jgi:hypothetical protein
MTELKTEFERLTGESVKDVLVLARKEENLEIVRLLMSLAVEHANTVGTPREQMLDTTASTSRENASGSSSSLVPKETSGPRSSGSQGIYIITCLENFPSFIQFCIITCISLWMMRVISVGKKDGEH